MALALRSQVMARNDLRDLQTRYDALQTLCQQQTDLLRKLTPRLQEAAAQLRGRLPTPAAPTLLSSTDAETDVKRLAGTGGAKPAKKPKKGKKS